MNAEPTIATAGTAHHFSEPCPIPPNQVTAASPKNSSPKDAKKQADEILREQAKITAAIPKNEVLCRVTKKGDQKLSKGVHVPGKGDLRYSWRDTVMIDRRAANELEERGYVEIEDAAA